MGDLTRLPSIAAAISADLQAAGVSHAVSGAIAMAAHGYVRATQDVDVLVAVPSIRLPHVFEIIRRHGFEGDDAELIRSIRERYVAELTTRTARVEVLVPVLPYHATLVSRAVHLEVAGHSVPFVSLEDLVVLKFLWHRAKDVPDIHALVALAGPRFDAAYARSTLDAILPPADPRLAEFDRVVDRFRRGS